MRRKVPILPPEENQHIDSLKEVSSNGTCVYEKTEINTDGLKYTDFSINTIIEGGYTDLLNPCKTIAGSNIEQVDSFSEVVKQTEIETKHAQ